MRIESWDIPVWLVISLVIFFTRFGLLGAVVVNTPNYSPPLFQEVRDKGFTQAVANQVSRREIGLVLSYWCHWHWDYYSWDVTVLKLDSWSRRPWLSCIPTHGRDSFAIIRLNSHAVVVIAPLRLLLFTLWWYMAGQWWRQWQRERWSDDAPLDEDSSQLSVEPRWNDRV